jgi:hypothetical protein
MLSTEDARGSCTTVAGCAVRRTQDVIVHLPGISAGNVPPSRVEARDLKKVHPLRAISGSLPDRL